jgi:hypothetical protein
MKYEIGDSVKFSNNSVENFWKKGFVMGKVKTVNPENKRDENGFVIFEEDGTISTLGKTGIHLFSERLFKSSKVLLCEKNIIELKEEQNEYVASMVLNIILGLPGRDA